MGNDDFVLVCALNARALKNKYQPESPRERIVRVTQDARDLANYYNIPTSKRTLQKSTNFLEQELAQLALAPFDSYDAGERVDYLLLKNWINRKLAQLRLDDERNKAIQIVLPFIGTISRLCEDRQDMKPIEPQLAADEVHQLSIALDHVQRSIEIGNIKVDRFIAYRAARTLSTLQKAFHEWFSFYNGYDPLFSWWLQVPFRTADDSMTRLTKTIDTELVSISETSDIVGQPIGRAGLAVELEAELIAYNPEEIILIGESEYKWCRAEMEKASDELGYGDDWMKALEYVKNSYVKPGEQPQLIHDLAHEAIEFVTIHDMVTVPDIAASTWRMFMMSPEAQKANPFFLGGSDIEVSYPTDTMTHQDKLMSMRGNNPHFSRSTVFHELIPGHKLQFYSIARHKPHRAAVGDSPFWIEGWAFYWEMVLWDDDRFPKSAKDRIGMLFWRMHRCARIIFSLNFHLGKMTPQECIDFLVSKVGFERANAEGEVRRSFNGDYSPLYQAGYMLGALQFYALRKELVETGIMPQKTFHDLILRQNMMPIELLRAYLLDLPLDRDMKASWRFYGEV